MKINKGKLALCIVMALSIITISFNSYAHSGRTDSNGGHKDNQNKSGLGSYHYHCGGYPAHLHPNGVCPYSSNKNNTSNSSSSIKSNTSSSTTAEKTTTITATQIKINENIETIQVGEEKTLTITIQPTNTTNKNVIWKSSNEEIATIDSKGKITAKQSGTIEITATTSNGKSNTIKISVIEKPKEHIETIQTREVVNSIVQANKTDNIISDNNKSDSNVGGTIVALGMLGGGGYWTYKKMKKK